MESSCSKYLKLFTKIKKSLLTGGQSCFSEENKQKQILLAPHDINTLLYREIFLS